MSLFLPFNHRPSNTIANPASYTCPAGKYARIIATIVVSSTPYVTVTHGGSAVPYSDVNIQNQQGNDSKVLEMWIKDGDVISKTTQNTTVPLTLISTTNIFSLRGESRARLFLNSTKISELNVRSNLTIQLDALATSSIQVVQAAVDGYSDVTFMIEEYDIA